MASEKLVDELEIQVMDDGLVWESSTNYHKFVTELVINSYFILQQNNLESSNLKNILNSMLESLEILVSYNGNLPNIGDNDESCVIPFQNSNANSIISLGYTLLGEDNKNLTNNLSENLFWYKGIKKIKNNFKQKEYTNDKIHLLKDSGILVKHFRKGDNLIDFYHIIGNQNPKFLCAGHRHSDLLSINIFVNGEEFIADGGTYKFFSSLRSRILFKSHLLHSNVIFNSDPIINFKQRFDISDKDNAFSEISEYDFSRNRSYISSRYLRNKSSKNTVVYRTLFFDGEEILINDKVESHIDSVLSSKFLIPNNINVKIDKISNKIFLGEKIVIIVEDKSEILSSKFVYSKNYGSLEKATILSVNSLDKKNNLRLVFNV